MFIARQPIFKRNLEIYGYELLFRLNETSNEFGGMEPTRATATVVLGLFEAGIEKITDGKKAFINVNNEFMDNDCIELIKPEFLVIEVLENIIVNEELLSRLKKLKKSGYKIALDDFIESHDNYKLVPIAHIIKYDIVQTPLDTITEQVRAGLASGKVLLAEKIETYDEFAKAKSMGFHLFQGYFFSRPKVIGKTNDRISSKIQYANIISELKKKEPSYDRLSEMIAYDVDLAYRLMKVVTTKEESSSIESVKYALVRMGFKNLERWITIIMIQKLSEDKPSELFKTSLLRSKFGEFLTENSNIQSKKSEASMMCLFSSLDAILDVSMKEALEGITLSDDVMDALLYHKGPLVSLSSLITQYEKGDWDEVNRIALELGIDEKLISSGYISTIKWVDEALNGKLSRN